MPRQYIKIEQLSDEIFRLKAEGKTHRQIGGIYGLTKEQIKRFMKLQRRKDRLRKAGYLPRPKGRPRKQAIDECTSLQNEVIKFRMKPSHKFAVVVHIRSTKTRHIAMKTCCIGNSIRSVQINLRSQISPIYRRHMACAICAPSLINAAK